MKLVLAAVPGVFFNFIVSHLHCIALLSAHLSVMCLQALMQIVDGSSHFHLSRDQPPPHTANITYTKKRPRQISVSFVYFGVTYVFNVHIMCIHYLHDEADS